MPTSTPRLTVRTVPDIGTVRESEETVLLRSWIAEAGWWAGGCVDVEPSGGR